MLLAATGSVACVKLPEIIKLLVSNNGDLSVEVRVVATTNVSHFVSRSDLLEAGAAQVYCDDDEWHQWRTAQTALHIDLRRWADLLLLAPLDANTLAKLAGGLCDNLVTCVARAWDLKRPVVFCPAMNTHMWTHPLTSKHISCLETDLGYLQIAPIEKRLACGDVGIGAMASVATILEFTLNQLRVHGAKQRKHGEQVSGE